MVNKTRSFSCSFPFTRLLLGTHTFGPCCPTWYDLDTLHGGVFDPLELWNSKELESIRDCHRDKSFTICKPCPYRKANIVQETSVETSADWNYRDGPQVLVLATDASCNLHCVTCYANKRKSELGHNFTAFLNKACIQAFKKNLRLLDFSGGDPFHSFLTRDLLLELTQEEYPHLKVSFETNGLLLPQFWSQIDFCRVGAVHGVSVSTDAGSKEIYEIMRPPGKWETLLDSLKFVSREKEKNDFFFQINMVVCSKNWRDVANFIELGRLYGCDRVFLRWIENWGHFSEEEYKQLAIHRLGHFDFEEAQDVVRFCVEDAKGYAFFESNENVGVEAH